MEGQGRRHGDLGLLHDSGEVGYFGRLPMARQRSELGVTTSLAAGGNLGLRLIGIWQGRDGSGAPFWWCSCYERSRPAPTSSPPTPSSASSRASLLSSRPALPLPPRLQARTGGGARRLAAQGQGGTDLGRRRRVRLTRAAVGGAACETSCSRKGGAAASTRRRGRRRG